MTVDLSGRAAVVTGAAQGIGRGIAEALARAGASLALVDVNADALRTTAREIAEAQDATVRAFVADLSDASAVRAVADEVLEAFGSVDILVNNAGIRTIEPVLEIPLDSWSRTLAVNLTAPFLLIQAFGPGMVARGRGHIVNVASVAAELAFRDRAAYNSSKAGIVMLTKSVALELGQHGVRCNAVSPGIIETPLNAAYVSTEPTRSAIITHIPVGHVGQPAGIAGPVLFLCSPEAEYVNGVVLPADGGWLAWKGY